MRLVNEARVQAGCAPLNVAPELATAADVHSQDMATANSVSHTGSDGSQPWERMTEEGYTWSMAGENIAAGPTLGTAQSVFDIWMGSPGHRANILNCGYEDIGVGFVQDPTDPMLYYWTQDFGARAQ